MDWPLNYFPLVVGRQGTSPQYQPCYLDLVISAQLNRLFPNSEAAVLSILRLACRKILFSQKSHLSRCCRCLAVKIYNSHCFEQLSPVNRGPPLSQRRKRNISIKAPLGPAATPIWVGWVTTAPGVVGFQVWIRLMQILWRHNRAGKLFHSPAKASFYKLRSCHRYNLDRQVSQAPSPDSELVCHFFQPRWCLKLVGVVSLMQILF